MPGEAVGFYIRAISLSSLRFRIYSVIFMDWIKSSTEFL